MRTKIQDIIFKVSGLVKALRMHFATIRAVSQKPPQETSSKHVPRANNERATLPNEVPFVDSSVSVLWDTAFGDAEKLCDEAILHHSQGSCPRTHQEVADVAGEDEISKALMKRRG